MENADWEKHRTELSNQRTFQSTARSHMSNERTHLSYLRTALALMSFGITLNRLSIFLRDNERTRHHGILLETEYVGLFIVLVGMMILAWALKRYRKVHQEIESDTFTPSLTAISVLTMVMLFLGLVVVLWMSFSR